MAQNLAPVVQVTSIPSLSSHWVWLCIYFTQSREPPSTPSPIGISWVSFSFLFLLPCLVCSKWSLIHVPADALQYEPRDIEKDSSRRVTVMKKPKSDFSFHLALAFNWLRQGTVKRHTIAVTSGPNAQFGHFFSCPFIHPNFSFLPSH